MKGSEHKDISDPTYSGADFWLQLSGGRLRWFASVFAAASAGMFVYLCSQGEKADLILFDVHGRAAVTIAGVVVVVWLAIAALNWRNWLKRKNQEG